MLQVSPYDFTLFYRCQKCIPSIESKINQGTPVMKLIRYNPTENSHCGNINLRKLLKMKVSFMLRVDHAKCISLETDQIQCFCVFSSEMR